MPIGALAGATAIAGIGSAVIGAGATKSAAKSAAATSDKTTQAQLELGRQNLAQQTALYNANFGLLSPFVSRGNTAGESLNALLGLPAAPVMQSPLASTAMSSGAVPAPTAPNTQFPTNPGVPAGGIMTPSGQPITAQTFGTQGAGPAAYRNALGTMGAGDTAIGGMNRLGATLPMAPGGTSAPTAAIPNPTVTPTPAMPAAPASATALTPTQAFDNFANSAGMKFQLQQGSNALNNLYAAHGQLQSGAAAKALQSFGQQTALQNYFMPYMSLLGGQQSVGAQAGSSVAGVGSNFGNTAASIYGGMGSAIGQNGANAANAALAAGSANANLWGNVGTSLGNAFGQLGSSYMSNNAAAAPVNPGPITVWNTGY